MLRPRTVIRRIQRDVERHGLFGPETRILVACSGGRDSVALLLALRGFGAPWRLSLEVGHVHHGLRKSADADAAFVQGLCRDLGMPVHVERVEGLDGAGLEARARQARYEALRRMAERAGAPLVATGHTMDDQAETVLLRLLRGAGPGALAGILPRRTLGGGVDVVRPLLWTRRADLEVLVRDAGVGWREDETNRDLRIARNRIRHRVLPVLAEENPRVVETLAHVAEIVREEETEWVERTLRALAAVARAEGGSWRISLHRFRELPVALQRRVLREVAARAGNEDGISFVQLENVRWQALRGRTGSETTLPGGLRARRTSEELVIGTPSEEELPAVEVCLPVPGRVLSTELGLLVETSVEPADAPREPRGTWEVELDPEVAASGLVLRNRRPGDRLNLPGVRGGRKVSDVLTDAKVPRWERGRVGVIAAPSGEVLWVIGHRAAARARPRVGSKRRVRVRAWPLIASNG
ncbi:MAG: tRNA lysidine(34) synthetase TilS [Armatimonadota bacterium]|nr:tRNA lysidine(34) synthetase TilS [Armatimonadota bacterium]